ncbi:MAG: hypothetical protein GY715_15930, partial [Planctomycetes bacterium]|nr:hypothetical protein [Planctomycetota bacterium]
VLFALTVTATVVVVQKSEVRQTENMLELLSTALQEWELEADRKVRWGRVGDPHVAPGVKYDMQYDTPHVYTITEFMRTIGRSQRAKTILAKIDPKLTHVYDQHGDAIQPSWIVDDAVDDPDPSTGNVVSVYSSNLLGGKPLDPDTTRLNDGNGAVVILDAWGTPIRVVHPGRVADEATYGSDDRLEELNLKVNMEDQTVFIDVESHDGETFYGTELFYGVAKNRSILFVSAGPDGKFGDLSQNPATGGDERLHDQAHDNVYSYEIDDAH